MHQNIKLIRELRDYSQSFMSSQLKVSQSTYSRIEKGNVNITMSRLNQIANILKVEVTDIINFNETVVLKIFKKESNLST